MLVDKLPVKHSVRMIKPSILKTQHEVWELPHQIEQDKSRCWIVGAIQKLSGRHFFIAILKNTMQIIFLHVR